MYSKYLKSGFEWTFIIRVGMSRYILSIYILLAACDVIGQVTQKKLIATDYYLWSRLSAGALSNNGQWIPYSVSYESGEDTLFVKHVTGKIKYSFPGGHDGRFFGKDQFAFLQRDKVFKISKLTTGVTQKLDNVKRYEILNDDRVAVELDCNGHKELKVLDRDLHLINLMEITAWSYFAKANAIAYVATSNGQASLELLDLNNSQTFTVAKSGEYVFSDFVWQENGEAVAFLKRNFTDPDEVHVGLYRLKEKKYYEFVPKMFDIFPENLTICSVSFSPLILSPDGRKIFFGLEPKTIAEVDSNVQIWNTEDKLVYPDKVRRDGFNAVNKVGCWWPDNDKFKQLTDNLLPHIMLSGDMRHALLWNPIVYQPQQKQFGDTDRYLMDIETGSKKLLLEKQSGDESQTFFSAGGKYVSFFRSSNWWVYDIKKRTTKNITRDLSTRFYDEQYDWAGDIPSYGSPGWTTNDDSILVYDQYDLWKISPNGSATRLTHGRETKTKFRIVLKDDLQRGGINFTGKRKGLFNLSDGLLFSASSKEYNGFYKWNSTTECIPLVISENLLTSPILTRENQDLIYTEQNFNLPPRLMLMQHNKYKILFQSNPQHFSYKWGKPKIVNYQNSKGQKMEGILYYPADYDATKKYPVIVRIYEKLTGGIHDYVNPSLHNQAGFNKTNFITQGYFVFEPDIFYELGNPGLSAVDCVISAVNSILDIPAVDEKRLGLIGHSFGGYETNLIITKSNLFATAVAGAGISDLTTHFLYLNINSSRPNNYHFESGQFRMGKSLFENPEGYAANSPINFVNDINTPLLSWIGENDRQVSPSQSMEFHMALRRLSKLNVLLIYKEETHALMNKENQVDLAKRLEEWFGYFLKGEPAPEWITANWIR